MEQPWRKQLSEAIRTGDQLAARLELTADEERGLELAARGGLPFLVTPYFFSLIDPGDPDDPIRRQVVPSAREAEAGEGQLVDPLGEVAHEVAPHLIRRYPDRALLLVTDRCATYCRHCTRRRRVGRGGLRSLGDLEPALSWLEAHREVKEVLISGGDPLTADDRWLDALLTRVRSIPQIELIRVGSRAPVTFPQRITAELCQLLRRHGPVFLTTQFNHPREMTALAHEACGALVDAGIPLANQTVLLRGVNDCARVQAALSRALLRARVRPYYLMQCDATLGTAHLQTSLGRGLEIVAALRGAVSGLGVPTFVLDLPGGVGKVPLTPPHVIGREGRDLLIIGPRGEVTRYRDPSSAAERCRSCRCPKGDGDLSQPLRWDGEKLIAALDSEK